MSELKAFSPQNGEKNLKTPRFCDLLKFIEMREFVRWGHKANSAIDVE